MDEILVNTSTQGNQSSPAVTAFGTQFAAVWIDSADRSIKAQLFTVDGKKAGSEFVVSPPVEAPLGRSRPAVIQCGLGLVVSWLEGARGRDSHVKVRAFDRTTLKPGPEIQVSTAKVEPNEGPALASQVDGGFVVAWVDIRAAERIRLQRFGIDGKKIGADIRVNTVPGLHRKAMAVRLTDGNVVVGWRARIAGPQSVRFQMFDGEALAGGEHVAGMEASDADMTLLDTGQFVIAAVPGLGDSLEGADPDNPQSTFPRAHVFEADGSPSGMVLATDEVGVVSSEVKVASMTGGRFLLAWRQAFGGVSTIKAVVMSAPQTKVGQSIQLNTAVGGTRLNLRMATVLDGAGDTAFVAWDSDVPIAGDNSGRAVHARSIRIPSTGFQDTVVEPSSGELLINTKTVGNQQEPAIASVRGASGPQFIAVWTDFGDSTIRGQRLAVAGSKIGGEFIANTPTPASGNAARRHPVLAAFGDGSVIAWVENARAIPGPRPHLKLQVFDHDGAKSGPEVQVSASDVDATQPPAIAGLSDGGFILTWADSRFDRRIRAQLFKADGSRNGDEFGVNTADGFHERPIVTTLASGKIVIGWISDPNRPGGGGLILHIFDTNGALIGNEIPVNLFGFRGGGKAMTALDNGRFAIANVRKGGQSDLGEELSLIETRIFESDGSFSGRVFFATHDDPNNPAHPDRDITSSSPALAPLPGGKFILLWGQKKADTVIANKFVRAKVFSDRTGSVGEIIQVNTSLPGQRFGICAAAGVSGGTPTVMALWADDSATGGDASVAVRGRPLPILASGGVA